MTVLIVFDFIGLIVSPDLIMPKYSPMFDDCFRKNQEDRQQSLEQWILAYYQKCLKLICRSRHMVGKYHSDLPLSPEFGIQEVFELSSILLPQWLKYRCYHVNIIPLDVEDFRMSKYKFLCQGTVLKYFRAGPQMPTTKNIERQMVSVGDQISQKNSTSTRRSNRYHNLLSLVSIIYYHRSPLTLR